VGRALFDGFVATTCEPAGRDGRAALLGADPAGSDSSAHAGTGKATSDNANQTPALRATNPDMADSP